MTTQSRTLIRASLCLGVFVSLWLVTFAAQTPESQSIDKFFTDFTAEWMRANPTAATGARYFTGDEQDRLERQLTPETNAYRRQRIDLARKGLAELRKFDVTHLSETQR